MSLDIKNLIKLYIISKGYGEYEKHFDVTIKHYSIIDGEQCYQITYTNSCLAMGYDETSVSISELLTFIAEKAGIE